MHPEWHHLAALLLHQASYMVTSCRAGEVLSWADSLRHLLQGARAGRSRRPLEQDSSDSDEEVEPEQAL
eukprot:5233669-Alexandrium_andersonii.AAC.1